MGVAERLVEVREKNGYTRTRLADELERPYRTITKYETGEREPGHSYIVEIAKKFNVSTDYILGVTDSMVPSTKKGPSSEEGGLSEAELSLVTLYRKLNQEGQEKLLDLADDLVSSGKYIKSDSSKLGKAQGA